MFLLAAAVLIPAVSSAQDANGRVFGTVYDPQGAVIAAAQVTVTNTATQVVRTAVTDSQGYFQVLALPIGNYKVKAEHTGFRTVISAEQKLLINQALRIDIKMEVGAASETVDVGAEAAPVETVNPTLGQSITGRTLTNMPLNGRDALDLALLQPGVTESNDDNSGAGNYSIAGGRTDSVTFLLDGGLNNDLLDNSNLLDPNPDSIAEFRLLTSNYTAEYGRNGGGIISEVIKSGSNQIHGSAFDFFRNRVLDANDFFNIPLGIPRLDLKRNQFGGTLGGPIRKDKAFFFLAYQGQKQIQAVPDVDIPVYTPQELQGNFSEAVNGGPDPNVAAFLENNPYFASPNGNAAQAIIDPTKIDPVTQNYINAGLVATSLTNQTVCNAGGICTGLLSTSLEQTNNANELTTKFDFNLSTKDKISATIGANRTLFLNPFPYATVPGFPSRTTADYYFTNIGYTRIFSPTLLNEFHFVTHRSNYLQDSVTKQLPSGPSLGIGITPDLATGPTNIFFDTGYQFGPSEQGPTRFVENTFSWTDAVSWTRGRNNWKFGAGFSPYQENLLFDYFTNGEFDFYSGIFSTASGNPYADFLLGGASAYFQGPLAASNIRSRSTYVFGQDELHVRKNLVLTMGLRYEYNTPKYDTEGRSFSVIPGLQSQRFPNAPLGMVFPGDPGAPTGVNFPDKKNFAPRFGFAWDPTGSGKTSVRGGFGLFYDILKGEDNLQFNGEVPFYAEPGLFFNSVGPSQSGPVGVLEQPYQSVQAVNPFPSKPPTANVSFGQFLPINGSGAVFLVDPHLRTPYVYQYNLSLQHNLFADTVLEANYVGSSGRGLTSLRDVNPMVLGTTNRALDSSCLGCFGQLPEFQNVSNANYNALEASLTRQPKSSKLGTAYFTLAYTYGHNLDNASGFAQRNSQVPAYSPDLFYASGDSDVRQRISFSGGWDLPFDRMWATGPKRLTKGWSVYPIVTWRTGFPFDIPAGLGDTTDPTNPGTSGAGDPILSHAAVVAPIRMLNPRQLTTIYPTIYGSSPNNPHICQITTGTPITGHFIFDPNSFSNIPLTNNAYYEDLSEESPNPCFPQLDPVGNPADRTYGLARNVLRGPHLTNLDVALAKTTAITERVGLEFRVEYFNALNHPEFAQPTVLDGATNINGATFGQITTTGSFRGAAPRIGQLAVRITF
ncbi:MAG TPA: TonB-dependent receptor [Candidatus Sulfotelmatobacter sp.]|nr:TonB-dependent receptor [Candidatus Sulfotelmatobacter sp.]